MEADRHRERLEDAGLPGFKDGWWGHEPRNAGGLWPERLQIDFLLEPPEETQPS